MNPIKLTDVQVTRLYRYGNCHFHAADLIYRELHSHIPINEYAFTSLNLAMPHIEFGIELKFKYLHIQEHREFMPIHQLDILFKGGKVRSCECKGLSKDTQDRIDNAFQHVTAMKFLEFYYACRDVWNQRYIFAEEKTPTILIGDLYLPLKDKLNEVLESVRTIPLTKHSEQFSIVVPSAHKLE